MSYLAKTPHGLLPCLHCGGEAEARSRRRGVEQEGLGMSMYHFSDTEAVEHDVNTVPDSGDFERVEIDGQWYVPERTCRVEAMCFNDETSEYEYWMSCGHDYPWYDEEPPDYCPECGARIEVDG